MFTKNTIPIKEIIISVRYRKEFGDIDILADNISQLGLLQPVVINENNELIDGQRRILAFEKLGKTEIPFFRIDLEKLVLGEFSANHYRKEWTYSEMVAIKRAIEPYDRMIARKRLLSGKPPANFAEGGESRNRIAGFVGISHTTLDKAEQIVKAAEQEPEKYQSFLENIDSKRKSVDKVFKRLQKEKRRQELKSIKPTIQLPKEENCKLILNDFTKVDSTVIPDSSIDLIFTDPPYGYDSLPLYKELAVFANRVLKSSGSLVIISGKLTLNEIFRIFDEVSGLKYWWTLCVKHNGPKRRIHPRSVFGGWKPLIWYVKGEKPVNLLDTIFDFIESRPPDKVEHEGEQSVLEAEHMIKYLTVENQIVLDPMMGLGTTGVVALNLDRNFIGIEKEEQTFESGKNRIARDIV